MQGVLKAQQLARVLRRSSSPILLSRVQSYSNSFLCRGSDTIYGNYMQTECNFQCQKCSMMFKASFSTEAGIVESSAAGKKVLWKHNIYGLTPNIGSAHHLLLFAKQHNDVKLLVEIMNLVKKNDLILQPGTADIVFSICSQTDNWDLICKYGKRFVKAGVKLRKTSLDTWMEFASKIGDVDALWKIEKIRSETMKEHTLGSGLSCAKGFLIDHKPEDAAAVIHLLNQTVPDSRRQKFMVELQKLVADWPLEVIKRQKDERRKCLVKYGLEVECKCGRSDKKRRRLMLNFGE